MKKIFFIFLLPVIISCGISRQSKEIKALGKCKYDVESVDSVYISGIPLKQLINQDNINLSSAPALALGFLRKYIPFEGRVNLHIDNPTTNNAAINQFEYIILLQQKELAQGLVNQRINITAGESVTVPVSLKTNIYELLSDGSLEEILNILKTDETSDNQGMLTLKIKPIIFLGNTPVKYPGYLTIDKKISKAILL